MTSAAPLLQKAPQQELLAMRVVRGTRRLLATLGYSSICELVLPNGRRADIAAVAESGRIIIVEVKSSAADFRSDQKWPEYMDYCDGLYFAVGLDGPRHLIPEDAGLIVADSYFGELVRDAPILPMTPGRRRTLLLGFARHAAERLHRLQDPKLDNAPR